MFSNTIRIAAAALFLLPATFAQFRVADREIQVHGFVQQGYAYSDKNNFLTMRTNGGSFVMTDGAVNVSSQITDRFRAGAQVYSRNIGDLGNGRVEIDWAYGDYKFADWFGMRAGKVKTVLGLYNDTQDMEFLHTWALLPQALYPIDLRSSTIAHVGGDFYGNISLKRFGHIAWTAYAGVRPDDPTGGYRRVIADADIPSTGPLTGRMEGADVKWTTPVDGLMLGSSMMVLTYAGDAVINAAGNAPWSFETTDDKTYAFYFDYARDKWHFNGEYRRNFSALALGGVWEGDTFVKDKRGWFLAASYRPWERVEIGTYQSRYYSDWREDFSRPDNVIRDHAIAARFDLSENLNLKVEGHLMNGYGNRYSAHGFYYKSNPQGLAPETNMFVIRLGYNR